MESACLRNTRPQVQVLPWAPFFRAWRSGERETVLTSRSQVRILSPGPESSAGAKRRTFAGVAQLALPSGSDLNKQALYSLGYRHASLGRIEEGKVLLRKVLELDRSYLRAIAALSELLLKTGQVGEAEALIARARQLQPDDPEILLPAGQCHVKRKEWNQAVSVLAGYSRNSPIIFKLTFFLRRPSKSRGRSRKRWNISRTGMA